jgi:deoxyhypusine synthase
VLTRKNNDKFNAERQIREKSYLVATDTGAVAISRSDTVGGLPKRGLTRPCILHMASEKTIPIFIEAFVDLTLGWCPMMTWIFIAVIADEFILGLDVLHTHYASMDLGFQIQ